MNKKIVFGLGLLLLLSACGPTADIGNAEMALDEASDNYFPGYLGIPWTEYGLCNDGWDNDGNGLKDSEDPACHVLGPVRDLSIFPAPIGNNFAPDPFVIPQGSPGSLPGGFRDRDQITRWMRFLTDTNGITAGIDLIGAAMDSPAVPVPVPLFPKVLQATAAQGNNNNIDGIAIPLNAYIPPSGGAVAAPVCPAGVACAEVVAKIDPVSVVAPGATGVLGAAPAQANTLNDSYNPDMLHTRGNGYGHHGHNGANGYKHSDMKAHDHQGKYAPVKGLNTLGRQSSMFGGQQNSFGLNNQAHGSALGQSRGAYPQGNSYGNGQGNGLDSQIQGTSLMGTEFGAPGDWPKSNGVSGFGQANSWGQQQGQYPQGNILGQGGRGGSYAAGNSWGQGRGAYPQGNGWGQVPGAGYPQGNGYGQGLGAYPQGNGYGQGLGAYPQGNSFGQRAGSWPGAR